MPAPGIESVPSLEGPAVIHNCAACSLWLPEGTLACPECHTIVYTRYLRELSVEAVRLEQERKLVEARAVWSDMRKWVPPDTEQAQAIAARIAAIDAQSQAKEDTRARWTRRLGPLAPVAFFLLKAKTFLFALLKFKFFLSFFAFFGLYWALFGWRFGLGFAGSILVHELGHYVAVRRRGLQADLPVFLPGLGAYVRWYHQGIALGDLAAIALAGPLFGLFTAIAFLGLYVRTGTPVFAALAHAAAWLNLINLVPVLGLDGAQATYALNRLQRGLILAACLIFFAFLQEGVFLFIAAGMAWRLFRPEAAAEPHTRTLVWFTFLLFALGAVLWVVPNRGL